MTTHIRKLSSIADKLRELEQPLEEMQLVTKALATLPEKFRIVRSVWANVPLDERTMDNLLQRLRSEENVLKSYERPEGAGQAFAAHGQTRGWRGNRRGFRHHHGVRDGFVHQHSSRAEIRCGYCFIYGHETHEFRKRRKLKKSTKTKRSSQQLSLIRTASLPFSLIPERLNTCSTRRLCSKTSYTSNPDHGRLQELETHYSKY